MMYHMWHLDKCLVVEDSFWAIPIELVNLAPSTHKWFCQPREEFSQAFNLYHGVHKANPEIGDKDTWHYITECKDFEPWDPEV
jgi:hypothetical protein